MSIAYVDPANIEARPSLAPPQPILPPTAARSFAPSGRCSPPLPSAAASHARERLRRALAHLRPAPLHPASVRHDRRGAVWLRPHLGPPLGHRRRLPHPDPRDPPRPRRGAAPRAGLQVSARGSAPPALSLCVSQLGVIVPPLRWIRLFRGVKGGHPPPHPPGTSTRRGSGSCSGSSRRRALEHRKTSFPNRGTHLFL